MVLQPDLHQLDNSFTTSSPRVRLSPIILGGGHERGLRSGTLNVPGIVGFGRAAEIAHGKGALLLLDGCQAVPRIPVDVAQIGADFYAFSAHKLYGPTGIGCLWGRTDLLSDVRVELAPEATRLAWRGLE